MSYVAYRLIHFLGIFMMLVALAAASMHVLRGGSRADNPHRRALGVTHGLAAFLIILGGFGMLARLGIAHGGLPGWIYVKLVIWGVLAAAMALPYFGRWYARVLLVTLPLLTLAACATALYKPM